jgi:glycosyltransferase involved in cell wall biosynthesis
MCISEGWKRRSRDKKIMRVLFVTQYSGYMGANRSLLQIAEGLRKRYDLEVSVLLPLKGEMSDVLDKYGISYQIIKMYDPLYLKRNIIMDLYHRGKGLLCELLNLHHAYIFSKQYGQNVDLVHTNTSVTNIGAYIAHFLKVKHVWHIREFATVHYGYQFPLGRLQYRLMNKYSDKVITISKALYDFFRPYIDWNKLEVIYNGIEFNNTSCDDKSNEFNVVTVGLIHPSKHQDEIIFAWKEFLKLSGGNGMLYIVGGVDPCHDDYYKKLESYVSQNGMGENVVFTGYQKDVQKYYTLSKVGILASTYEAFGRVTVEYMVNRLVPIVKNSGANPEIVDNNHNGFVYNTQEDLVGSIFRLYIEDGLYNTMSVNAYNKAILNYSLLNCINRIYSLYKSISHMASY